jgi:hypothetical protein
MTAQIARIAVLALAALSTAQAAEPTGTLTLACKGTETHKGSAGISSDQINIGVMVDFQKKIVTGLGDSVLTIDGLTETTISFSGGEANIGRPEGAWNMSGTLDRVTGSLVAASTRSNPRLTLTYDLHCRSTHRMF